MLESLYTVQGRCLARVMSRCTGTAELSYLDLAAVQMLRSAPVHPGSISPPLHAAQLRQRAPPKAPAVERICACAPCIKERRLLRAQQRLQPRHLLRRLVCVRLYEELLCMAQADHSHHTLTYLLACCSITIVCKSPLGAIQLCKRSASDAPWQYCRWVARVAGTGAQQSDNASG